MILKAAFDRSAEINLFAFESEEPQTGPFTIDALDDDWIEMEFKLQDKENKFYVMRSALTAAEIMTLIEWLTNLADNKQAAAALHFTEPNLAFEYIFDYGKSKIIRITFSAELRPDWYKEKDEYTMLFHLGRRQLADLAGEWFVQLMDLYNKAGVFKEKELMKMKNKIHENLS